MKRLAWMVVGVWLVLGVGSTRAHEEHEHEANAPQEQTLVGEVVDVFCYLSHGAQGLGKDHAGCAKQCIQSGLPVAIKVGDQLYLASMADHTAANQQLADLAGQQVSVRGHVMERDGQRLITISHVEKAQ